VKELNLDDMLDGTEAIQTGIALYSKDFALLYANPAAHRNFPDLYATLTNGATMEDAMAAQARAFRPDISEAALQEAVNASMTSFKASKRRTIPLKDGRWIDTWHAPTKSGGYIGISLDVTNSVTRENELDKARKAADSASAAKSEFLAAMSHELRTPLNGIQGMAQAILSTGLDETQSEMMEIILQSASNLTGVLNNILDISHLEADKMELSVISTDVRDLMGRLEGFYAPLAQEKGLSFNLRVANDVPERLTLDPARLRQCISNLLSNAIKFTHEGGVSIAVTAEETTPQATKLTIYVHDTGIGVHPDSREDLFEKFRQADNSSSREFGGSGLGLPVARRIANLMKGDISVASRLNEGSVFTLTLEAETAITKPQLVA